MLISELPSANSIKVGELYFKPSAALDLAQSAVRLITFEHEQWVGRSGSCTLFRHDRRRYIVATRHSLAIPRGAPVTPAHVDNVRFSTSNGELLGNIPTNSVIFEKSNPDEEYHDLLVFDAVLDAQSNPQDGVAFFPLTRREEKRRLASFMVGYPTVDGVINYDPQHVILKPYGWNCRLDTNFRSSASYLRRYSYEEIDAHVGGLSGGAVFCVIGDVADYSFVLDAIILRGGNGSLYAIDTTYLIDSIGGSELRT